RGVGNARFRRRDAAGICGRGACRRAARLRRGRARAARRQGQCAALEPGDAGGRHRGAARRHLRAAAQGTGVDTIMSYETILVETRGAVTLVTLNRPQALNALNSTVLAELIDAFAAFDADPGQRCLVLTGSVKAFAAGADIKELSGQGFADMHATNIY